ncbi:MAG TPA: hypothetical protein VGG17_07745 [Acidimicrobiales bacterium]
MRVPSVLVGISVSEITASERWYGLFFGRAPDVLVSADEVMWQLNEQSWLFIVADESIAQSTNVVLAADDLNDALDVLACRGIEPRDLATPMATRSFSRRSLRCSDSGRC